MALNIDSSEVSEVLLADGWHQVRENSLNVDVYSFVDDETQLSTGTIGFSFIEDDVMIAGPLSSILAVRTSE